MRQYRQTKKPTLQACGDERVIRSWCWLMNVAAIRHPAADVNLHYVARATSGVDVAHQLAQLVHQEKPDW